MNRIAIVFEREPLITAYRIFENLVPSRTQNPVLLNVKVHAAPDGVVLTCTDGEVGISRRLTAVNVLSAGEFLLPTDHVLKILRASQSDRIEVESEGTKAVIRVDRCEYDLKAEDPATFPSLNDFSGENHIVIRGGLLKQMIRRTIFATSTATARYALGGVLVDLNGNNLSLVATDTRRLALAEGKCSKNGDAKAGTPGPLIPAKAMSLIERSVTDDAAEVQMVVNANDVLIRCGGGTIYSRLIEGRFPRYRDVIPNGGKVKIDLAAGSFYSAVRQAQIMTSEESRGVIFTFGLGMITMHSVVAEIGESRIELPISYDGPEVRIKLDARFLADFLEVLEPEQTLTLELIDSESAALFRTQDGYTYAVMPLSGD